MRTSVNVTLTVEVVTESNHQIPADLTIIRVREDAKTAAITSVNAALQRFVVSDGTYGKPKVYSVVKTAVAGDVSVTGL